MNNISLRLLMVAALLCGGLLLVSCGGGAATNTATTKPADAPKTDAPKTDASKPADTASTESVGVPECDEYIKKYEACLTKIAKDAPQAQAPLKTAFESQRKTLKDTAANPSSKSMMPGMCKQFIESAKQSTSSYSCEW